MFKTSNFLRKPLLINGLRIISSKAERGDFLNTDKLNLSGWLSNRFITERKSTSYKQPDKLSGQIQFVRAIFYEKERGVQVSKQKLEIREAMTLLLLYYASPPTKLRVAFINTICSERLLNLGPYRQPKFGGYKGMSYFCPRLPDSPATELFKH